MSFSSKHVTNLGSPLGIRGGAFCPLTFTPVNDVNRDEMENRNLRGISQIRRKFGCWIEEHALRLKAIFLYVDEPA